ncbi:MAG: hypothetical protein KDC02_25270, partial [Flavobacteriales bacterium]|nr:hypothetical protein [Flavobacteriales bacterium]
MQPTPFLTAWDPRQTLKGSRDPLGSMGLWTHQGRRIIGNLTTVSTQVRDFTATMLGYHLAERVRDLAGPGQDVAVFLKWEQLAAYVRAHVLDEGGFRGVERTRSRLAAKGPRVTLSARSEHQILGDQKVYGLMGTYTMPGRSSGLLEGEPLRLTPAARELVEAEYLPRLAPVAGKRLDGLARRLAAGEVKVDLDGRDAPLAEAIGKVLTRKRIPAAERRFYQRHLLYNQDHDTTGGLQGVLAAHMLARGHTDWEPAGLRQAATVVAKQGPTGVALAEELERAAVLESVLAPVGVLFG